MALSAEVMTAVLTELAEQIAILQTELTESAMPVEDPAILDHLYRAAHTMKGLAGAVEMHDLHRLSNAMELVISQGLSCALVIDGSVGTTLREASAACAELASGEVSSTLNVEAMVARIEAIETSATPTRRVLFHATAAPYARASGPPGDPPDDA